MRLVTFLLLLPAIAFTQANVIAFPMKDGKVFFEYIDSLSGMNQKQIHSRTVLWVANNFKNSNAVTRISNETDGEFVGKGSVDWLMPGKVIVQGGRIGFTMRASSRDGKLRLQFYDLEITNDAGTLINPLENYKATLWKKNQQKFVEQVNGKIEAIHLNIISDMEGVSDDF